MCYGGDAEKMISRMFAAGGMTPVRASEESMNPEVPYMTYISYKNPV